MFEKLLRELQYVRSENEKEKEKNRLLEQKLEEQSLNEILKDDFKIYKEMMAVVIDPKDKSIKHIDEFKEDELGCLEQTLYMINESKNDSEIKYGQQILGYIYRYSNLARNTVSEKPSWFINDYDIESKDEDLNSHIGSGSFCYVIKGTYHGSIIAKKVFNINSDKYEEMFRNNITYFDKKESLYMREIEIWNKIKPHPFILHFYGAYHYGKNPFIISEYCNKGTVKRYTGNESVTVNQKLQIMHDIAIGIYHLHQCHIIHGDIKSSNVLISNDGTPKICDFGLSVYISNKSKDKLISACSITEATRWKAPELFKNYNIGLIHGELTKYQNTVIGKISTYSDIFSLGRLYYEIIAQDNPFYEILYNSEVENRVVSNQYPQRVVASHSKDDILCSNEMWDVLVKTWDYDPYRRIPLLSLASILNQLKTLESNSRMKIFIKTLRDEIFEVEVKPTDTILYVKYQLQKKGISLNQHYLLFQNEQLNDDRTLSSYNIVDGSTIHFFETQNNSINHKMKIYIGMVPGFSKDYEFELKSTDTISEVKGKVKQKIYYIRPIFIFKDKELKEDKTLSYYNIMNESTLYILKYPEEYSNRTSENIIIIFIKTVGGTVFDILVNLTDTILNVKHKIQGKEGVPADLQRLIVQGNELDNGKTLSNYNIQNGYTIDLVERIPKNFERNKIIIIIKALLTGASFQIEIEPTNTILYAKYKIQEKVKLLIHDQRIIYFSMQLEDNKTLNYYNIVNESVLILVPILRGG
eukprot:jgi/Orpsp1_1/1178784/evm.model.c7180000066730.2